MPDILTGTHERKISSIQYTNISNDQLQSLFLADSGSNKGKIKIGYRAGNDGRDRNRICGVFIEIDSLEQQLMVAEIDATTHNMSFTAYDGDTELKLTVSNEIFYSIAEIAGVQLVSPINGAEGANITR